MRHLKTLPPARPVSGLYVEANQIIIFMAIVLGDDDGKIDTWRSWVHCIRRDFKIPFV